MHVVEFLDSQVVDWDNYEKSAMQTRAILELICEKKDNIRSLIKHFEMNKALHTMCETHQLLNYIVLYDNPDNGIRVRLHMSTAHHLQRPHDHRFDFSSKILKGCYEHIWYYPQTDIYKITCEVAAKNYQDKDHPDPSVLSNRILFKPMFLRKEGVGSCFSISHKVVHTVEMEKDTVTLIIRSPARTKRSFIYDINENLLWWRFSNINETPERRMKKIMTKTERESFIKKLTQLEVI